MLIRRLLFLVLAVLLSGTTVVAARAWLQAQLAARPAAPVAVAAAAPQTMVLVAKTDLPAGSFVRPENLRWQPWPADGLAETYVVQGRGQLEDFVGAVVRSGIVVGEPIVDGRVVRPGDRGFMAAVLTPGRRAVTVAVTPSSGLAGFVFPGDRVDVILTMTLPQNEKQGSGERRGSETVLADVRVLAVDQLMDDRSKEVAVAKTATLEVTPKQAEVIAVAGELGKLSLSLRSLASEADASPAPHSHTWDAEAARLLPASGGRKVSVVRGSKAEDVEMPARAR
jgi:pilus assembly protein CpaB